MRITLVLFALAVAASALEVGQNARKVDIVEINGQVYTHGSFYSPNAASEFNRARHQAFSTRHQAFQRTGRVVRRLGHLRGQPKIHVRPQRFLIGTKVYTKVGEVADPNAIPIGNGNPTQENPEFVPLPLRFVAWFKYNMDPTKTGR